MPVWRVLPALLALSCASAPPPDPDRGLRAERRQGWEATTPAERREVRAFARAYLSSLAGCPTVRRTARTMVGLATQKGFATLGDTIAARPGARFVTRVRDRDFAAIVLGRRPLEAGFNVVIARMDSPRIDLKPRPTRAESGFLLLQGRIHGEIDMRQWLSQPLALHGHVVREGGDPAEVSIGADPGDPVFVIPDLLPHLADRAQAHRIVEAEDLDAVAATTETGDGEEEERLARTLLQSLDARFRLGADAFEHGEWSLVPAIAPTFLGVDEGLVGGYGQAHAANLFAALHAIGRGVPERTAVVIGVDGSGPSGAVPVVPLVLGRVLSAAAGAPVPEARQRRILARSRALFATNVGGTLGRGIVVNARHDDALPAAVRAALDAFDAAGAQWQLADAGSGWGSPSRRLGELEVDSMDVAIPIAGVEAPMQILSPLDLWSAYRAYWGFFGMAD